MDMMKEHITSDERARWNSKAEGNHYHSVSHITDFPSSLPANGGNSDTVDGKHASELALAIHQHDDRYYTESEMDSKLNGKSNTDHTHDSRYYTETEVDNKLSGKSNIGHTHSASEVSGMPTSLPANGGNADTVDGKHASDFADAGHNHDSRYYTESEIDTKLTGKSNTGHTHTTSDISGLPTALPADGGNADTVDGKHASAFASADHNHSDYYNKGEIDEIVSKLEEKIKNGGAIAIEEAYVGYTTFVAPTVEIPEGATLVAVKLTTDYTSTSGYGTSSSGSTELGTFELSKGSFKCGNIMGGHIVVLDPNITNPSGTYEDWIVDPLNSVQSTDFTVSGSTIKISLSGSYYDSGTSVSFSGAKFRGDYIDPSYTNGGYYTFTFRFIFT